MQTHSSILPPFHSSTAFGYTFSTKEYLPDAKLYLYQYRVYDPIAGRWTQRDPIDYQDSINLYQFCGNNPVNLHDADGKWTLTLAGGYGYAARVTIGHNGGRWHVGYGVGFGLGASIKYDPANQEPGPATDGLAADMRVEASVDVDVGAASIGSSLGVAGRTDSHNNNYTRIEVSGDVQMRSPDRCIGAQVEMGLLVNNRDATMSPHTAAKVYAPYGLSAMMFVGYHHELSWGNKDKR